MALHGWLSLAATPTFAITALLTMIDDAGRSGMLCLTAPEASPINGMVAMYFLMSAFHLGPWLRRFARWRRSRPSFAADRA